MVSVESLSTSDMGGFEAVSADVIAFHTVCDALSSSDISEILKRRSGPRWPGEISYQLGASRRPVAVLEHISEFQQKRGLK